ncbi:MAG: YgiQ family radical SAM protein [Deltaproteobacteria bacterium]|nr:YgiQ family radical SAM protein [Deltaproteobacteria bacterium]
MFLPATAEEVRRRGWDRLDVILITGDAYIDSPFVGVSVIGQWLLKAGYRVGIIAQPDVASRTDIARLGEPALFWGVTGGCIDSLVANRTASGKRRREDDYTAGGINNRRPDRAVIVYANLIRRVFKETKPIVLGGIEASLRRIAHYDFWSDQVRRSILLDAKANFLVYGMGEKTILALAAGLREGRDCGALRGLCRIAGERPPDLVELPSYEQAAADPAAFTRMFLAFYRNQDPRTARGLCQLQDSRWLIHNPPMEPLTEAELDDLYALDFARDVHPLDRQAGKVRALETIRFSLATHRGCYGECHFCAIALHEGRTVSSRSEASILREAKTIAARPDFKGHILDVGGPTANMYGYECKKKRLQGACSDRRCLYPGVCPSLCPDHSRQISLLGKLRRIPGVKRVTVASGIRCDLVLADRKQGIPYLREVVRHHVSGQLKVAPEHSEPKLLRLMGKPVGRELSVFRDLFFKLTREAGKDQFLTYYLIAAHPGCTEEDMEALRRFASRELGIHPEQVQLFTPTPSTLSTLMYFTERDPFSGKKLFVEKTAAGREGQKKILVAKSSHLMYGISVQKQTPKEEGPWARTKTSRRKPRRNPPRR